MKIEYKNCESSGSIETDKDGVAHTKDGILPYGSYTLHMVEAPEGIEMPEQTEIPFTVTSSSSVDVGTMTVTTIKASLTGKRISDETGEPVSGVPFRVTSETNGNIYTAVTGVDGRFTTAQLPYDNYKVEELSGASNRNMEKASFRIAVRESGMIDLGDITKDGPKNLDPKYILDSAAPLQKPDPQHPDQILDTNPTPVPTATVTAPVGQSAITATSVPTQSPTPVPTPVPQPTGYAAKTDDGSSMFGMYALLALGGGAMAWLIVRIKKRGAMWF